MDKDVATDNLSCTNVISLNIKLSKTDQGRVGCQVVLGKTNDDLGLCYSTYLGVADSQGLSFSGKTGLHYSKQSLWKQSGKVCLQPTSQPGSTQATALELELQQLLQ